MTTATPKTALVIGATGSFGVHALCALVRRGWIVRALARDPVAAARKCGERMPVEWIAGDAMRAADVAEAARGAGLIVHAANPPGYRNWRGLAVPMLANTIAAAVAGRARIVLPGTVYNFAPDSGPLIAEDAPQAPVTRKGRIRVEMEAMLRQAAQDGARVLVLRAGDFFGPAAPNSALKWLTTRRRGRVTGIYRLGSAGHAFAYAPDMAEVMGRLIDREADLAAYEVFHFAGHWIESPDQLAEVVRRAAGDPRIPLKSFPVAALYAAAPFVTVFREMIEMLYLWKKPIGLRDAKLRAFLGEVPSTPLEEAMRESLADLDVDVSGQSWTAGACKPYIASHAAAHAV